MQAQEGITQSRLSLSYGGCSLKGARDENQDAFLVKVPQQRYELEHKGAVACIADGASCSDNSQKASHTAVMQFVADYYATPDSWSIQHCASKILTSMNNWLFEEGLKQSLKHNGFVTTFSAVIFKSNTAHLFHVGDTRIYRLRDNTLKLLTRDHQRVNFGQNPHLTRALGMDNRLDVDYQMVELQTGDRFILTSDGVHDAFTEEQLSKYLREIEDKERLSNKISSEAIEQGSADNATCLLLDVDSLPQQSLLEHQAKLLSRAVPPALKEGNRIDHFLVQKVLYAGPRSHVYQVLDENSGEFRVLKAPSLTYSEDTEHLNHLANEFWVGSQLKSERVMRVYPTPSDSKFVYQLCEWVDGITLRQWMYDNPTPTLSEVRTVLEEIIKAVRVLQRADMVHRDLKPENIMVTDSGKMKLIDFGAVKALGLDEINHNHQESEPLGAVNYIAPESIDTGEATTVSDLFSVAVIGYEMLCGELPYKPISAQVAQTARHHKWHYRPITQFREDIPSWLDLVFRKATQASPNSRYQVLGDFLVDLSTPNQKLVRQAKKAPLLKREPLMFWKSLAIIATGVAVIQSLWLLR
ncbi:protein kinase [Vibrio breoganii]|uniref:bifunctional protein-serine/threonine kinase/phosphatase n=1 Tax=Vibrio breoganii TaxID=553239 RepID=UPI000C8201DB|nr:bifunctional protein-serine/threonine kinase/phosphatase [Vibrio breoganii]PMK31245.1 serine/threonine protein kinase [Vibrio breoganii]PML38797.1 serine/threonine protein kinase [Vibrio breoganii]PMM89413.1 serine/threonine protein kinase [Vibrio breoganii]PMO73116.1 serine/threonine protein kinase [Vibrio breoganii]PMO84716.1 serine/threonine protein kinase [Vibrio breoganii]